MFSKKGRCATTALCAVAAALLLLAQPAQAQCRGGTSQLQTRSPQSALMTVLQRQQLQAAMLTAGQPQVAVLNAGPPQNAMLIALQQQNAMLATALQQQQQQNVLRNQNGKRPPKEVRKLRREPIDAAQPQDAEAAPFVFLQPK